MLHGLGGGGLGPERTVGCRRAAVAAAAAVRRGRVTQRNKDLRPQAPGGSKTQTSTCPRGSVSPPLAATTSLSTRHGAGRWGWAATAATRRGGGGNAGGATHPGERPPPSPPPALPRADGGLATPPPRWSLAPLLVLPPLLPVGGWVERSDMPRPRRGSGQRQRSCCRGSRTNRRSSLQRNAVASQVPPLRPMPAVGRGAPDHTPRCARR